MSKQTSQKLTCAHCGYENEPERVYCHNCGTKLDRSVLPKETVSQQENLAAARRRIKRMTNPGQGLATVKTLARTLLWAALVAIIYLIVSPPGNLPSREDDTATGNVITSDIDMAVDNPASRTVQFTRADLSTHLRSRIKGKDGVIPGLQLKRPYVVLDDGKITIGMEQSAWGYSLYTSIEYRVWVEGGQWKAEKVGMRAGRLGIHPAIPKVDTAITNVLAGLKQEKALLDRAEQISITKDRVVIVTRPKR